jgi:hypothetical protein
MHTYVRRVLDCARLKNRGGRGCTTTPDASRFHRKSYKMAIVFEEIRVLRPHGARQTRGQREVPPVRVSFRYLLTYHSYDMIFYLSVRMDGE